MLIWIHRNNRVVELMMILTKEEEAGLDMIFSLLI